MEELANTSVQLVLSIKEGRGFQQLWQTTSIIATLNGHCLETDLIEPSANPQYEIDLVWEIEKSKLRKMRSGQAPLKLECFAHKSNEIKEKIGYLLLNVRSAQIIAKNSDCEAKAIWHKLLGLRNDLKADKPELHLSLSIYEQESNIMQELKQIQENPSSQSEQISPVLLPDLRLIQLGPINSCQEIFLLSFTAISATNINQLISTQDSVGTNEELSFLCKILENDVYFKPFLGDSTGKIMLNEKIVVRIRSSLKILKEYLKQNPYLPMFLKHRGNVVGQSEVELSQLVSSGANQEFNKTEFSDNEKDYRCYFHRLGVNNDNTETDAKKSYIDLQLRLQYLGMKSELVTDSSNPVNTGVESSLNIPNYQAMSEIHSHRNAAGDFASNNGPYSPYMGNMNFPNSTNNVQSSDNVFQYNGSHNCNAVKAYNCYFLHISLNNIKMLSSKYSEANVEIWFHHPKTGVVSKFYQKLPHLSETLKPQDVGCKLHFISSPDEIRNLLVTYPPKISINESTESKACISECIVDVKKLFYQNKSECQYTMTMYGTQQIDIADFNIKLSLENQGSHYAINRNIATENLGPPILDESLVYKIVDELETWKDRQKEMFKYELKKKEERHLNLLGLEWQKQKETLEAKLACSVEQCKMLASSLNNATEDLRMRRLKSLEKEARLIKANEDLQWRYESKVQELKDSLRSVEDELTTKVNALEKQKAILETQVEPLTIDNERLRVIVKKQSEELEAFQKGSLTQDQTTNLLQELKAVEEKLHDVTDRKSFFKEQWCKAVREIHRMKTETQQAMQMQIKNRKEELENLDLEEILQADTAELATDRIMLQGMQRQINDMTPKPSFSTNFCHGFPSGTTIDALVPPNTSKSSLRMSESIETRLQNLIEERDSLLNTGSYTSDDTLIVKLNAEIRSLMK